MDLDILFYGDRIIMDERLTVPHPYISEMEFVLKPLESLAPHFIRPVKQNSMRELLKELISHAIRDADAYPPGITAGLRTGFIIVGSLIILIIDVCIKYRIYFYSI